MTTKRRIPESELIINPTGTIYHLELRPGEVADTIITVGDPGRVEEVSRHFDNIQHKANCLLYTSSLAPTPFPKPF